MRSSQTVGLACQSAKSQIRQPSVGGSVPDRRNQQGHLPVAGGYEGKQVQVVNIPGSHGRGSFDRENHDHDARHVQRQQFSGVGDLVPIDGDQHPNCREVAEAELVQCPIAPILLQYVSQPASLYQASVSAMPASRGVRASKPSSCAARRVSQVQ